MATQYTAGLNSGDVLTAATMNSIGAAFETWTPALTASTTNPTLGTGSTATGVYGRINKLVYAYGKFVFGSSMATGTGTYRISFPVTAKNQQFVIGSGWVYDASANRIETVVLQQVATTYAIMYRTATASYDIGAAVPWTWASSDELHFQFSYEIA